MKMRLLSLLLLCVPSAFSLDPFSTGVAFGAGVASTALYAAWDRVTCQFSECCAAPWVANNFSYLESELSSRVFGQHLVVQTALRSIKSHVRKVHPQKALVLSFHGWTGGGKNFVAKIIADSLYKKGMKSKFVNLYMATLDFPNNDLVDVYKLNLQDWIRGNVTSCAQSVFIFDEMDKMPEGLIDAIKPFIDHHESVQGVDFRRAIFIFLSNTGGREITQKTLELWKEGKRREEFEYRDFEGLIHKGAFNEAGGLHHSTLLERSLVDLFVPFLPMEKDHVRLCVEAEAKNRALTKPQIETIVDSMSYWPRDLQLYSTTGCKRVAQKVDYIVEEMYDDL